MSVPVAIKRNAHAVYVYLRGGREEKQQPPIKKLLMRRRLKQRVSLWMSDRTEATLEQNRKVDKADVTCCSRFGRIETSDQWNGVRHTRACNWIAICHLSKVTCRRYIQAREKELCCRKSNCCKTTKSRRRHYCIKWIISSANLRRPAAVAKANTANTGG